MQITKEAIEKIESMALQGVVPVRILEDDSRIVDLVAGKEVVIAKKQVNFRHQFNTLEGFTEFVTEHAKKNAGQSRVVFVSDSGIKADLDYAHAAGSEQLASLSLAGSDEYQALVKLMSGVNQEQLVKEMLTRLDGAIGDELLLQAMNMKVKRTDEASFDIARVGGREVGKAEKIEITWTDKKGEKGSVQFRNDWTWRGRIWTQLDSEYVIHLTLRIDENGVFHFHPKKLNDVLDDARRAMVDEVRERLPGMEIYDGQM